MRPVTLTLDQFACYRQPTTIDFDDAHADLFAIAGPTGSGKSVVLDGICFALYGQTARLGARGAMESLVAPGAQKMMARLEFATGLRHYRVTRVVTVRNSGAGQEVRIEERVSGEWKQHPASEKVRDANEALAAIVGLDYDGFTRAVLLPQGAFDEFLRGDAGKRRKVLTNLLGLDRLTEMAQEAGRVAADAKSRAAGIAERLAHDYADATEETLQALGRDLTEQIETADAAARAASATRKRSAEVDALRRAHAERDALRRALQESEQIDPERLDQMRRAEPLRQMRDAWHDAEQSRVGIAARLEAAEKARARADEAAGDYAKELRDARADQAAAQDALGALERNAHALAKAWEAHDAALTGGDASGWTLVAWEDHRDKVRSAERDAVLLAAVTRARARVASLTASREDAEVERIAAWAAHLQAAEAEKEAIAEAERALEALDAARVDHAVASLTSGLAAGDPCPACGTPLAADPEPDQGTRAVDDAKRALDEARKIETQARNAAVSTSSRADLAKEREQRIAADLDEANADTLDAMNAAAAAGLDPEQPDADLLLGALRSRSRLAAAATAYLVEALGAPRNPDDALREARAQANLGREVVDRLSGKAIETATEAEVMGERVKNLTAERATAKGKVEEYHARLQERAWAAEFPTLIDAMDAMPEPGLLAKVEAEASRSAEARARIATLSAEIADRPAPTTTKAEDEAEAVRLGELEREANGRVGATRERHDRCRRQIDRAAELHTAHRAAEAEATTYQGLANELRGDRFPAFVLTKAQDTLAAHASYLVRRITDDRYDLVLADGDFHVLDAWADGAPRSARTLSGGETFIASLALALALSDTIAGSAELGALFLDEGFGTLDAVTLDAVAGTLEHLTGDGRKVGIVTHVEALVERMPARLRVTKTPEGSTVAWES